MRVGSVMSAAAVVFVFAGVGSAQLPAEKRSPLTAEEKQAVAACLTLVRDCQLPDGAFAQISPAGQTSAPVWIAPYFANFAALALLADYGHSKKPDSLERVGRWLDWCAKHQSAEGYWNDFEGTAAAYKNNGNIDAWDSSAALFLLATGRYQRAGGQATPAVTAAAARALACIEKVTDSDGLTWATPTYKVKFLMDNVEVRAGLRAAGTPAARAQADRIDQGLSSFWQPSNRLYAYALHANGTFEGGLDKPYPQGLAQLFGVAFIAPKATAWTSVSQTFKPEDGPTAACGAEWWLMAADRAGVGDVRAWRERVVGEVASFSPQQTYLQRPALAALALLDGADWMTQ